MENKFGDVFITHKGEEVSYVKTEVNGDIVYIREDGYVFGVTPEEWNKLILNKKGYEPRLYVLINNRLNSVYGCVQGGHAVAQYMIDNPAQNWNNSYLIYLSANTEYWHDKLTREGIEHSVFKEVDFNDTITAIACRDDSGKLFRELETIK